MGSGVRALEVVESFEMTGRGTAYVAKAPEPPHEVGETVLLDGAERTITAVEFVATNPPKYVVHGLQTVLLT